MSDLPTELVEMDARALPLGSPMDPRVVLQSGFTLYSLDLYCAGGAFKHLLQFLTNKSDTFSISGFRNVLQIRGKHKLVWGWLCSTNFV